MKKTIAPSQTPSPTDGDKQPMQVVEQAQTARAEFFAAALAMSWQLAIVVLVPIIGGFELDRRLNTLPALTIVGFVLAMVGMGLVVWRQLQLFSPPPSVTGSKGHHS